jgi:3-oxoadipate enol-lactonase
LISDLEGPAGAPVLVLANPIGTTRGIWAHQVPALRRHFRLLRFDWRGHGVPGGQSPAPPVAYTLADLGTDVLRIMNERDVPAAAYAGVSLGGMVGLWLAANAPDRITSLAVCCAAITPMPSAAAWRERTALVRASGMAAIADAVLPRWFTPSYLARSPSLVAPVRDMLLGTSPAGYAGCGEAIASMDLAPLLPSVKAPALVLSAEQDVAAPPWQGARTALAVPGARLTVVRGTSHLALWETPGPVTAALLSHFVPR